MTIKERLKNDIMVSMRYYVDFDTMSILENVLIDVLTNVEVVELETLPATLDNTNQYIIDLFMLQKAPKLSEKTVSYYLDTINRLIECVQKPLIKMTQMDIERYLMSLQACNNATSLNNQRRNISAFFTWLRKTHIIVENPCEGVEPYKEIEKPIDHIKPEEFEQLKSGCKYKRDRAMLEVLRSTAMRVGELENVKVNDIDWRTGKVSVYGHKTRTYRVAYLDTVAMKYLSDYLIDRNIPLNSSQALFTALKGDKAISLSSSAIRGAIGTITKRSELNRRVYPHLFRKTCATNVVKRGGTIQDAGEYLGHKDRSTAGKHYACIDDRHTEDIFRKYVAMV